MVVMAVMEVMVVLVITMTDLMQVREAKVVTELELIQEMLDLEVQTQVGAVTLEIQVAMEQLLM